MKLFRLALIVALLGVICALFSGVGFALEQDEVIIQNMWSNNVIRRGDNATLTIFFASGTSDQLEIYRLGLHFDWMDEGSFIGFNMSNNPVTIPSKETHYFNPMIIQIPDDVSLGTHIYNVTIEGYQGEDAAAFARGEATYFSWEENWPQTPQIMILDSYGETNNNGNNNGDGAESQQDQLLILGGLAVVAVVAIVIITRMRPRKKKIKRTN